MSDFRARIEAFADLGKATSDIESFVNKARKLKVDVDLNLTGAGQNLAGILSQLQGQARSAGSAAGGQFASAFNGSLGQINVSAKNFDAAGNQLSKSLSTVAKAEKMVSDSQLKIAGNNLTAWASKNTKAIVAFGERIRTLQEEMEGMQNSGATAQQFKEWSDNVKVLKSEANATGNVGKTFADSFGSAFSSMVKFAASYVSIRKVFSEMENGIRTVVALDDALVDLQKTTTATPQQLNNFYNEANNIAKQYGTTTQQIIQGAAD